MPEFPSLWTRRILSVLFVICGIASVVFGVRTYHSFQLLRSAYDLGVPSVSTVRPWMTLEYIAEAYHLPRAILIEQLGLPANAAPDTSLRSLALGQGSSPVSYVQHVQGVLAGAVPGSPAEAASASTAWLGSMGQDILAALLIYGYPVLGLTLLLGAIGLPLPAGLATIIVGSLAAAGKMSWGWAGIIALMASVLGDIIGYVLGRLLSPGFLERRARWLGYTAQRHMQVESLFKRWGGFSVILTRTLVSPLGSVVNLFAGASHYRLGRFVLFVFAGRLLWTAAYLGLGYAAGSDLEAASSFLSNFSLLLIFLASSIGIGLVVSGRSTMLVP
ncbi:MAG: DedA family protein [Rhodocyclaceae bacterium]|nr:MAG: DedA family protein [Rhodocyclaceae bacterium]